MVHNLRIYHESVELYQRDYNNITIMSLSSKLCRELNTSSLKSLYLKNICLLMYNFIDDIAVQSHNYSTRLKSKSNVIVPKIRTVFG